MSGERHAFLLCVKKDRVGADQDYEKVERLLKTFHFTLHEPCIDPKSQDIIPKLEKFRKKINETRELSCVFIFIMAHGDTETIHGTDGGADVEVDDIFSIFNNENCPKLQLKPKVFVIQACRGKKIDPGVISAGFRALNTDDEEDSIPRRLPTMSDTFTVYPSLPGFVAIRNPVIGSKMFVHMEKVFNNHWSSHHLYDLFVKVNQKMVREEFNPNEQKAKTTLMMESTLTKAVYLTK
ncbi:caspase-14-like isoform X2 [Cetorhinus maximus]